MSKSASLLVRQQVPEFVVNDSPRFIEFMKAYYEYLDSFNVDIKDLRSVDDTADSLVQFLKSEFANKFPNAQVNDRKLLKIVRELYKVKGTVNAIDLLFRVFFSEAVTVWEPGKQLLRPSDGRWEQLQSITAVSKFGVLPTDVPNIILQFSSNSSIFNFIEAQRVELVAPNTYTIYFRYNNIAFEEDQEVDFYSGASLIWKGRVVRSPVDFEIVDGGEDWKLGQIVRFPGTQTDTILQVSRVLTGGVLAEVKPIEWGRFHTENQSIVVSPYPNKPTNASYDIQSTIVGYDSGTDSYIYDHVIQFNDYIDSISENVVGYSDTFTESSYVGSDYVEGRYVGLVVIAINSTTGSSSSALIKNTSVTIEEWLASRATIVCKFGDVTTYLGKYLTEDGQVSNPSIRIQDSYFYQLFSYVIQTTRSIEEYEGIISIVHPAGYKYFNDLLRTDLVLANNFTVTRSVTNDKLFFNDLANVTEDLLFDLIKYFGHSVTMADDQVFVTIKPLEDAATTSDSKVLTASKSLSHEAITSDDETAAIGKFLSSESTGLDALVYSASKAATDSLVNTDTQSLGINKSITAGTTSVDDNGSSNSQSRIEYTTDDFFGGDYVSDDITLQIG